MNDRKYRRAKRVRAKIVGTSSKPRLALHRSNRFIYAQLVDDGGSRTLAYASTRELSSADKKKTKTESAMHAGELLAKRAAEHGIKAAVVSRRHYRYHGRVKALVEGARKGGLKI